MAHADQMHQVTESAAQAQATAVDVSDLLRTSANTLRGQVDMVIPAQWDMDQAAAFSTAHNNWQLGIARLIAEMEKIGVNIGMSIRNYENVDVTHAANLTRVETPPFNGELSA